jgi:hypothetical protein
VYRFFATIPLKAAEPHPDRTPLAIGFAVSVNPPARRVD